MPTQSRETLVLGNATRLLDDARLLVDHRRIASAFALAVLGVEEIGKALIEAWNADAPLAKSKAPATLHVQKQTAVSSLLVAAYLVRVHQAGSFTILDPESDEIIRATQKFNEGDEGRLFYYIRGGQLDRSKQAALYQDDLVVALADDIAEEHVDTIFQIADDARDAMTDSRLRRAARVCYEKLFLDLLKHIPPAPTVHPGPD